MVNNGLTVEQFPKVKPYDFIDMVADEIRCLSKPWNNSGLKTLESLDNSSKSSTKT